MKTKVLVLGDALTDSHVAEHPGQEGAFRVAIPVTSSVGTPGGAAYLGQLTSLKIMFFDQPGWQAGG